MKAIHVLAPVSFGGGEKLLLTLLKERKDNLDEEVLLLFCAPRFERELEKIGITYHVISNKDLGHGIGKKETIVRTIESLANSFEIRKILNDQYDIIHMHGFIAMIVTLVVAPSNVKLVYTHHSERAEPSYIEEVIFTSLYNRIDEKIGVSETVTDSLNRAFPRMKKKFITISNCISGDFFDPIRETPKANETIRLIQVGRFTEIKNQIATITAIAKLPEKWKNKVELWFVGDGELREYLQEQCQTLGVKDNIEFLGAKEPDEIVKMIDQCDFGVMSSKKEGFGLAAVEYMARGVPVIAIENRAMREVVGDTGYLVAEEKFVTAFLNAFEDGRCLKSNRARKKSLEYTPERTKGKYLSVYYSKKG